MDKGTLYSGIGHIGLIAYVAIGGLFFRHENPEPVAVTEVSLLSSSEFEALLAASPTAPPPDPAQTEIATPAPVVTEPQDAPRLPTPDAPVTPVVTPAPRPAPAPEAAPDVAEIAAVPAPDLPPEPTPPAPVASLEPPINAPVTEDRPRPRPATRVAPQPSEAPAPDAAPDPTPTPAVTPEAAPEAEVVVEERPETAPEEAGTELATEANKPEPLAPSSSSRPRPRPARTETAVVADNPAPASAETEAPRDAIADAVAAAMAETSSAPAAAPEAPAGPPMTSGEKDALRFAVQQCWNVGSLSTDALRTTVVVAVSIAETGVPDAGSIRMIDFSGGTEGAARQAYEAARRAIIRCGATGFKLPPEKYEQWRNVEMVFNPENMRIK
ncbi:MAG: cell envelope biogenesis protein TolA [Pseudorhodobacter sp.]|jgi:hypothetical protein|nr:cell envelope biogenesis protein TolA [Pseudorhodobacter sp.]